MLCISLHNMCLLFLYFHYWFQVTLQLTVSQWVLASSSMWEVWPYFMSRGLTAMSVFVLGCPLWQEDGSVIHQSSCCQA